MFEEKASDYVFGLSDKNKKLFLESSKVTAPTQKLLESIKEPEGYKRTMELADQILQSKGYSKEVIQLYHKVINFRKLDLHDRILDVLCDAQHWRSSESKVG